jgi:hypothetical protein
MATPQTNPAPIHGTFTFRRARAARAALRDHRADCARWDFDDNNCETCDRLQDDVKHALDALRRATFGGAS